MKLITHNMMTSRCLADVKEGYPLKIKSTKFFRNHSEHNPVLVRNTLPKIDWVVLKNEAANFEIILPDENPMNYITSGTEIPNELSEKIYDALFNIDISEGSLTCPETGHEFIIRRGIPRMLINEDQV